MGQVSEDMRRKSIHRRYALDVCRVPCSERYGADPVSSTSPPIVFPAIAIRNPHLGSNYRSFYRGALKWNMATRQSACHLVVTKPPAPPKIPDGRRPPGELTPESKLRLCQCDLGAVSTGCYHHHFDFAVMIIAYGDISEPDHKQVQGGLHLKRLGRMWIGPESRCTDRAGDF
jgi:hypothetical protein